MITARLVFCFLALAFQVFALDHDFSSIDARIRALPKASSITEAVSSITEAVSSITEAVSSNGSSPQDEWAMVRGLYIWMTENISYDADAYFKGTPPVIDPEGVFRTGKSVCQGYSGLMADLGKRLGLEVVVVPGYAKGYGYRPGQRFFAPNHAWNAIKVDGTWRLFDSTWGAGHVDGAKFVKRYSELWFDTPPELFLYHHLPEDARWRLTSGNFGLREFETGTYVELYSLEALRALGLSARAIREGVESGGLPKSWAYPGYAVRLISAPIQPTLKIGKNYPVELESGDLEKVYFVSGGKWTALERNGNVFKGSLSAAAGEIWIAGFLTFQGKESFWPFLIYEGK